MKQIFTVIALLLLGNILSLNAQFSLRVSDPRTSWYTYPGTIEEATLSVRPKGIYWEYGLYLTFSARGQGFDINDSLEVVLKFELPKNAIIHDSWLWINQDIVKADILDRWTANNIYEGIVKRRQDPSILYKNGPANYELRVFPMAGNETRKVKITYLMPTEWSPTKVWAALPTKILNTSKFPLANLEFLCWPGADWQNPEILRQSIGAANVNLSVQTDPQNELYYQAEIPNPLFATEPILRFDTPLKNGRYLSTLETNNSGFYQLAMMPQTGDVGSKPQKVALLLDYDPSGVTASSPSLTTLLEMIKFNMVSHFRPIDSFNIIYSNLPVRKVSEHWLPATPENIAAAFSSLDIGSFSNLATLLTEGVDFCKENGNNGTLLLASNASQYYTNASATGFHEEIINYMGNSRPKIHILDYRFSYTPSAYIGGLNYYGNSYLNFRLAQSTSGSVVNVRELATEKAIASAIESAYYKEIDNLDFYTSVANGFCFGRYNVSNSSSQYSNKPILQVGRYQGSLPMEVEMSGSLNGDIFYNEQQIPESEITPGDSLCREMWFGEKIRELESFPNTYNLILDIVQNSLDERVLSKYTAFLCLEDPDQICEECLDETQFTSTESPESSADSLVSAYPNPFSDRVLITVSLDQIKSKSARTYLEIYNLSGQLVRQFESQANNSAPIKYEWDGTNTLGNTVSAGVYILMVKSGEWSQVMKLIKQ